MDIYTTPEPASPEKEEKKKGKRKITLERWRVANERLQIVWIRMTITLMAIGFTIYKVLESRAEQGRDQILGLIGGREIGLFLLITGLLGLTLATRQHIRTLKQMKQFYEKMPPSISLIQSFIILAFTLFLTFAILFRL